MSSKVNYNLSAVVSVDSLPQNYGTSVRNNAALKENIQAKPQTFPNIPKSVTTTIQKGDMPEKVVYRALIKAARLAGLPPDEQKKFAAKFSNAGMSWEVGDPDKTDGNKIKSSDYDKKIGQTATINLSKISIDELRNQRQEYIAGGGKLYSNREIPNQATANEKQAAKNGITAEQREQSKMRDLYEKAQILLTSIFGTPSKLRDLKHISAVEMQNISGLSAEDQALAGYIEQRYADRSNLYGDDKADILRIAKANGVKIENLGVSGGKADFDISVESLLKLHIAYIGVQEKANITEAQVKDLQNNSAYNQFLIGVGEGAWNNLKGTGEAIADPIGTLHALYEAGKTAGSLGLELAQMPETERLQLYAQLRKAGLKGLGEMPLPEASRHIGNFIGSLAVDVALGKGIGTAVKALHGLKIGTKIISETVALSKTVKQTLGNIKVPLSDMKVVSDTMGNKWWIQDGELKKLEDLIKPMESRAKEVFSNGRRNIEDHEILGGHTKAKHVGKSENWLRRRLNNDPDMGDFASSFRNEATANRVQGRFVNKFKAEIDEWLLSNQTKPLLREIDMNEPIGIVVERGKGGHIVTEKATLILVKDNSTQGWHFLTSFPNK